jgi:endonuclease/exonuclease/phosphatase family metal-dependent hydrolase
VNGLRVTTYNVRHCRGIDGRVDVGRTARTLARCEADVFSLQELDRNVRRSGGLDEPARLAELSGLHVSFFPTLRHQGGDFGIAIATRAEVEADFRLLDNLGDGRRHGVVVARLGELSVVATHLSRRPRARAAETAHLCAIVADAPWPAVVAGDLNQSGRHLDQLHALGFESDARRPTFPSFAPLRQIDHVLVGPGARIERTWTTRSLASDHLPLTASVVLG